MSFGIVAMFQSELPRYLPTADELPCSDDTPVDEDWSWREPPAKEVRNELQELIPTLLKSILQILWANRMDWFFGIDMGVYYHPEQPPIIDQELAGEDHTYVEFVSGS
jgi:Uma2 family endonuclease